MTISNTAQQLQDLTNGVDVSQLMNVIGSIEADTGYAKFQWRATNQWIDGELSRSEIKGFFAGNEEDTTRKEAFTLDADEPPIASGQNRAPNSMEYLLHALATCLTGTLVNHAAVRGIEIEAVDSSYAGDMDVRGLFGLAECPPRGPLPAPSPPDRSRPVHRRSRRRPSDCWSGRRVLRSLRRV